MNISVDLQNVTLDYPVYDYRVMSLRFMLTSLASAGTINHPNNGITYIRSVENVSLSLGRGDRLAIIGGNGAGKTSLLKTIAGIYDPSHGKRTTIGKITTLLGTGFGLDDEATGFQNIILGGLALGYRIAEMEAATQDIVSFTQLGEFLEMPLRTYSAGMRARLAFAIATCNKPDIVIIDEGIGAGDASFYEKANARLNAFLGDASILILASHSTALLRQFCNKALVLDHGKQVFLGDLEDGLAKYAEISGTVVDPMPLPSHLEATG
jgi:ABC-2 type transport system ATP-binding protein